MIVQYAVLFTLAGLAIGSFLNVCIDRLVPKRLLYMSNGNSERIDIEITESVFLEQLSGLLKDILGEHINDFFSGVFDKFFDKSKSNLEKTQPIELYVTGRIIKNTFTGNLQINVTQASQIVIKAKKDEDEIPISWEEAKNRIGSIVTIYGKIIGGKKLSLSLMYPPSHCDACQRRLKLLDLIPVFSYLFLRGRCRYCKAHIPVRVLLVEVITGLLFFLSYWQHGLTPQFGITVFWCCLFLVIIYIDWEHQLILNKITYPAAIIALVILAVNSFVPGVDFFPDRTFIPANSFLSGLISGVVILVFFLLIAVIRPGAMGIGDVKLVALIGFVSGFPLVVFSMIIGVVIGGVVAIVLLAARKKGRKDIIPYGTFLGIGPIIALIFEHQILNWYLSFF